MSRFFLHLFPVKRNKRPERREKISHKIILLVLSRHIFDNILILQKNRKQYTVLLRHGAPTLPSNAAVAHYTNCGNSFLCDS